MTIAVTGATGEVGGRAARMLADAGVSQRLLVRTPSKAPELAGAEVVPCDYYADKDAATAALRGVGTVFMVSAVESPQRVDEHRSFIEAAVAAGVQHVVYTSFFRAAPDATFTFARDHHTTEQDILASGLSYTFLRDNFYLDVLSLFAGDDNVIRGPGGNGRASFVARQDVARVAAEVLQNPAEHRNTGYDMTGGVALTLSEAAGIIADVTGRPVTYHDETLDEAYASRRAWDPPDWMMAAWVSTYTAIASGELQAVSEDVARITGRRPTTLAEVAAEQHA